MPLFFQGLKCLILLYIGVSQKPLLRLQAVHNAAARMLTGTQKREHITPILFSLQWFPVCFQIEFKLLLIVFKSLNGLAPSCLTDLLQQHTPTSSLRSSIQLIPIVPWSRLKHRGDRARPRLWNCLPLHVRAAPTLFTFKTQFKVHSLSQAFNSNGHWRVSLNSCFYSEFIVACCCFYFYFFLQHLGQQLLY